MLANPARRSLALASLAGALSAVAVAQDAATQDAAGPVRPIVVRTATPAHRPAASSTRILVRFETRVDAAQLDALLQPLDARVAESGYDGAFEVLEVRDGTAGAWLTWLKSNDFVRYAELDGIAYAAGSPPNDPLFGYQWHLMDHGATSNGTPSHYGVQAPEAWTKSTGAGAVVAIVDTGVAYESFGGFARAPDLASTTFVAGWDFVNNDAHPNDDEGHGTHVCGTIAQSTNNALGTAGVAYGAAIMPVKVLNASGSGSYAAIANGIRFAADNGAHVINMSLGGSVGSSTLLDAVDYAWSRGVVLCAATGNSGSGSIGYPARYTNCIAVGATRFDGAKAYYSQFGSGIDVVAPGGDVTVDQNGDGYGDGVLQQTFAAGSPTSFGYYFYQGTSMATPHVAGVAALVKAAKPSATAAEIRAAIETSCVDLGGAGYDTTFGNGLVDASAAIDAVLGGGGGGGGGGDTTPPAAPTGLTATRGTGRITLNWADNQEADLAGYRVYRSSTSNGTFGLISGSGLVAASAYTDTNLPSRTRYYYKVTAVDTTGNESAASAVVTQRTR